MSTHLVPLSTEHFPDWLRACTEEYASDLVATGLSPDVAKRQAAATLASAFPAAAPTPSNAVFAIAHDSTPRVGSVWVGRDHSDDPASWWVWDIVVDPAFRGRGLGRTAMQLAEEYARSQGARTLGLSVFGFNTAARGLYESLGYETTSIKMRKTLS